MKNKNFTVSHSYDVLANYGCSPPKILNKKYMTRERIIMSFYFSASFDFGSLETKANFDISDTALVDLCRRLPQTDQAQDGEIDVVFFGKLSTSFRSMLSELVVASKSVIFHAFWSKYCKIAYRGKKGGFTLEEVQNNVWKPAIDKLEHLAKEAKDGSVNLKSIDKNFKKIKDLEKELKIIFEVIDVDKTTLDQTVVERVSQIQLYNSLQSGMQAVETVWQFKESLHLTGDFSIIDELHDQVSNTSSVISVSGHPGGGELLYIEGWRCSSEIFSENDP